MDRSRKLTKKGAEVIKRMIEKEARAWFEKSGINLKISTARYIGGITFSIRLSFLQARYVITMQWIDKMHIISIQETLPIRIQFEQYKEAIAWIISKHDRED